MKNSTKKFLKISIISIIIVLVYKIGIIFINANNNEKIKENNKKNYKIISTSDISKTGVAITTNIGIKYNEKKAVPETIYQEIFSIEELKKDKVNVENAIIKKHMLETKEYFSLLKTDFKGLLKNSNDRKRTLEVIYSQLSLRYNNSLESVKNLEKQREVLIKEAEKINSEVENLKKKISVDFHKTDVDAVNKDIEIYLKLKQDYNYVRTYIVFINNFLKYYVSLNNYNLNLINVLSKNKDAIEKGSFVVIPQNGTEILKDYGLLYTEKEYDNILRSKEEK
ncbi:hypothetical protein DLH72_03840 [Candidatus Gracilibacteria bacterium]|nr:MAG: hypothetical protein DLH72_03840 [Candidatus Gracilibacteria bacterium]